MRFKKTITFVEDSVNLEQHCVKV